MFGFQNKCLAVCSGLLQESGEQYLELLYSGCAVLYSGTAVSCSYARGRLGALTEPPHQL